MRISCSSGRLRSLLRCSALAVILLVPSHYAAAQNAGGDARSTAAPNVRRATDSIAVARAAFTRANRAMEQNDLTLARAEIARAQNAWPTQPRYAWNAAFLASVANDTAGVLQHLREYADLGIGRDLRADSTYARYWGIPAFAAIERSHSRNRETVVHSTTRATIDDSTFWPEGMDVDARNGNVYVASMRHGTIAQIGANGATREIMPRHQPGIGSILGVRVDTANGFLYATLAGLPNAASHTAADSVIAALIRVRIADGRIERRWDLPVIPDGHVLGDLTISAHGDVFMTDSNEPVLYRLRAGRDTLERITSPVFTNLQGMAVTPDNHYVYVADYIAGLLRVDLTSGDVIRLTDAPHSTSIGCDGIVFDHGSLIAVQNGLNPPRVAQFKLDSTGAHIVAVNVLDQNPDVADEPTIGALYNGKFMYVANSQWDDHNDDGSVRAGAKLNRPVILQIDLSHE